MSWYQNAIFYQALVGSFKDSGATGNPEAAGGKGVGTLQGIIEKLDYLKWLGVRLSLAFAFLCLPAQR